MRDQKENRSAFGSGAHAPNRRHGGKPLSQRGRITLVGLASRQIGRLFVLARLPLISGCLLTGVIAGPHVLGRISADAIEGLQSNPAGSVQLLEDKLKEAFGIVAGGELSALGFPDSSSSNAGERTTRDCSRAMGAGSSRPDTATDP